MKQKITISQKKKNIIKLFTTHLFIIISITIKTWLFNNKNKVETTTKQQNNKNKNKTLNRH